MLDKLKEVANHPLSSKSNLLEKIDCVTEKGEMSLTKRALKNFRKAGNALVCAAAISSIPGANPDAVHFNIHGDTPPEITLLGTDQRSESGLESLFDSYAEIKGEEDGRALNTSLYNLKNKLSGHYKNPVGGTVPVFFHNGSDANLGFYERLYLVLDEDRKKESFAKSRASSFMTLFMGEPLKGHVNIVDTKDENPIYSFFTHHSSPDYNMGDFERIFTLHHEIHHSTYQDSDLFNGVSKQEKPNMVEGSGDVAGLLMAKRELDVDDATFVELTKIVMIKRAKFVKDYGDHDHNTVNSLLAFVSAFEDNPEFFNSMTDKEVYNVAVLFGELGSKLDTTEAMHQLFAANDIDASPEFHKKIIDEYWDTGVLPKEGERALFDLGYLAKDNARDRERFWVDLDLKNAYLDFEVNLGEYRHVAQYILEIHSKRDGLKIPEEFSVKDQVAAAFMSYAISFESDNTLREDSLKSFLKKKRGI